MSYEIHESEGVRVLNLNGRWTIESANELKSLLMDTMKDAGQVVLSLGNDVEADLSCLQLLCAAHRASLDAGKSLSLQSRHKDEFTRIVREAGYRRSLGCHRDPGKSCLWTEGWEA